ncbi:MAG: hypothetical protein OEM63_01335 [Gammaproteobacteria bacterium]|nr:hypothetical protein [Gammaproteobacteria bacterium]
MHMGEFLDELKRRNVVRVAIAYLAAAWLLIQLVETLFPVFDLSDSSIRLVVIVLAIGFPLVLLLSWIYELTPDGFKVDSEEDRSSAPASHRGEKLDRAIIVTLVLALGYFAVDKFVLDPARDSEREGQIAEQARSEALIGSFGDRSIAVLPFVNMSDDSGNEYFSDGISEELLNLLAGVPELRVISRSSSFSFKGKDIDIPAIAEQLEVAHILEGSVRKAGNQVRITAQLIDGRTDTHLWSDTYDRELEDVFEIQDEISAAIVGELISRLGLAVEVAPQVTRQTSSEAHEAYLRGRYLVAQRTTSSVESAIREFETTVRFDPAFAAGHAELANAILIGYSDRTEAANISLATPHVEAALTLDPGLAEARAAAGNLAWLQGNPEEALSHFQEAVRLNRNYSEAYTWMGMILEYELGRYEESFAARETALQLDPLSFPAIGNYISGLIWRNRLTEADQQLAKAQSISPGFFHHINGFRFSLGGNWSRLPLGYLDTLLSQSEIVGNDPLLATYFALLGLDTEALAVLHSPDPQVLSFLGHTSDVVSITQGNFESNPASLTNRFLFGMALAADGDYERARPILEEIEEENGGVDGVNLRTDYAAALVTIRRKFADNIELEELLAPIRNDIHRLRNAGITATTWDMSADFDSGLLDYLAGDRENGLRLIARAAENGFFIFLHEALLPALYDDPGFAPIRESQEKRQARERTKFLAVVCNDNPYESVWQPASGTCDQ